ncbi:MAG: imidazolonepropionase [Polyangiaceae bacterium]|nr:imidazolonepropionase [Polyangiaceae bacterium]MCW5791489.1 imidazolonepropionase [Polyangiaceae bacterium]
MSAPSAPSEIGLGGFGEAARRQALGSLPAPELVIHGAREVITCDPEGAYAVATRGGDASGHSSESLTNPSITVAPRGHSSASLTNYSGPARGALQGALGSLRGHGVAIGGGRVIAVLPEAELFERFPTVPRLDAEGQLVMPGFVDPHTHLLFGGDRADEWERRMAGESYLEILKAGGGILRTVAATRAATRAELLAHARRWLLRMRALGTTHVEAKTGYRLTLEGELELLELQRELGLTSTYLGAHVVAPEHRGAREGYLTEVQRTLTLAVSRGVVDFFDVFLEREAFSLSEARALGEHARGLGVGLKLHTDQFTRQGGVPLALELGATSIDHLEVLEPEDIQRLAEAKEPPVCVLLPGCVFHLGLSTHAPGRALIDHGVPVALATDFNPGTSPTPSMQLMIALAVRTQGLSVAEAIVAATRNAACAISRGADLGRIAPGYRADLLLVDAPDHRALGYSFGGNLVTRVIGGLAA